LTPFHAECRESETRTTGAYEAASANASHFLRSPQELRTVLVPRHLSFTPRQQARAYRCTYQPINRLLTQLGYQYSVALP
jgi:hypothetical protein